MTVIRKTKKKRTKRRKRKRKKRKNEKGETHPPILRTTGRGWFISAFNVQTLFSVSLDQTQNMFLESCF